MARSAWPTVATSDAWTASQHNTYGRDNDLAYWVYTTAGDLAYATSSSALTRLAIGTAFKVLRVNSGATAPEWAALNIIHAMAQVDHNTDISTASSSYVDVTSATVDIVTTVTCHIYATFRGALATNVLGGGAFVRGSIGGTTDTAAQLPFTSNDYFVPFSYTYRRASVGAGTITCKLQYKDGGGGTSYFKGGSIHVIAVSA